MQKCTRLLEDADVRRWYENLCRGSKLTASVRLRRLNLFCIQYDISPKELVSIGKEDARKLEDLLHDHVSYLESKQYAPSYIDDILKAIKSWLFYNYIELRRKIKIANSDIAVTLQNEKIPSKQELKDILNAATRRGRASISLMAFAGLRPQVLGKDDGSDALRISDISDLVMEQNEIHFKRIPAMILVRPSLSKARHKYITFLTDQGCQYLLGYLRARIADGESLASDSPVISVSRGYDQKGNRTSNPILTTKAITAEIRKAIWSVKKARPYVLRSYFDTQLLLAESHGKIAHAYRQFFMGHKGDMEARYTTNKGRLSDEMIEDMRRAFQQSEQFVSTEEIHEKDKKEFLLEMWKEQATLYGIDPLKIKIEKQRNDGQVPVENKIEAIKIAIQESMKEKESERYDSLLIDEDNLVLYVKKGWDIVKELSSGRILIRKLV